jgi:hypothetical protein
VSIEDEVQEAPAAPSKRAVGRKSTKVQASLSEDAALGAAPAPAPPRALASRSEVRTGKGIQPISQWFVRCLLVGFLLSFFALANHPVFHLIGVLGPIGATLAYPLIGMSLKLHESPSQRERFADNCYYLGFIFTQIALLIGFLPVTLFNREIGSQDVLRAFSLALGAALVGLVARTYFIQTGHSVSENSQLIEDEVEALAASVSRQAKSVLGQFEAIGDGLTGAYQELNTELATCVGSLVSTVRGYEAALTRDVRAIEAGTSALTDATTESVTSVGKEQQRFVDGLREAVQGVEAIRASAQREIAEATGAIRSSAQALAQGADALAGASGIGERLQGFEARVGTAAQSAERLQAELATTAERLAAAGAEAASALEGAGRGLTSHALKRADDFERELAAAVGALEQTLISFRTELERVRV